MRMTKLNKLPPASIATIHRACVCHIEWCVIRRRHTHIANNFFFWFSSLSLLFAVRCVSTFFPVFPLRQFAQLRTQIDEFRDRKCLWWFSIRDSGFLRTFAIHFASMCMCVCFWFFPTLFTFHLALIIVSKKLQRWRYQSVDTIDSNIFFSAAPSLCKFHDWMIQKQVFFLSLSLLTSVLCGARLMPWQFGIFSHLSLRLSSVALTCSLIRSHCKTVCALFWTSPHRLYCFSSSLNSLPQTFSYHSVDVCVCVRFWILCGFSIHFLFLLSSSGSFSPTKCTPVPFDKERRSRIYSLFNSVRWTTRRFCFCLFYVQPYSCVVAKEGKKCHRRKKTSTHFTT